METATLANQPIDGKSLSEAILHDYCVQMAKLTNTSEEEIKARIIKNAHALTGPIFDNGNKTTGFDAAMPAENWEKTHRQDVD